MSGGPLLAWTGRRIAFVSFSDKGAALAARLQTAMGGTAVRAHGNDGFSLSQWTAEAFAQAEALVFVGAVGIAVRAVAPYLKNKAVDPAVVAVDERGRFAVPVLSGHLGGANDLARAIGGLCGATAVITTATDVGGVFAVDEWARRQGCAVLNPETIKTVSAKLLAGETVGVKSQWPVAGEPPSGVVLREDAPWDVQLSLRHDGRAGLCLTPQIAVLGVGCRRNTPQSALEEAFSALLADTGLSAEAFCAVATIDLKRDEPGLLAFCTAHGWPLRICSAKELEQAAGAFTSSPFVQSVAGVDNVCERSAALVSGGALLEKKRAGNGVTMAVALRPFAPDWSWRDE